jgi:DNA adenine methylase
MLIGPVFPPALAALKPPLKWAGGKRWLVPHVLAIWQPHAFRRYVEPFCGGLALPLAFQPRRALLCDRNDHLIGFYRWLQRGLHIETPMANDRDLYYHYREQFNRLISTGHEHTRLAAELFYYLNRTGYNGLCRFNRRGEFNVPFGRHKTIRYVQDFHTYRLALSGWDFLVSDFEALALEEGDFVYADPPYDVEFVQYSRHPFTWDDQVRLAEWLARHPGPVLASNQATERIIALYERLGFRLRFLSAPRMISRDGGRARAREMLAVRNLPD